MNFKYIVAVSFLIASAYARSEENDEQSLSQRDVLEEESLREIRGIGTKIIGGLKTAVKGALKELASTYVNGKRTAEDHEVMKRLEAVMRDLDSLDYPEEASERETRGFNQEEIANLFTKKEKRILGPVISTIGGVLGGLLKNLG
uniref:Maximins 11/H1 n=3 Tax=Bombina TaxID=8344 RepID=M11H1_BOMMX|nr:RecName: Full=Maximins 11/H1; Contains: RecName: Full=Maximin-11; Contains: RecName: Full=Maximin-H1; AltName: Full=Maximin-6; Flags: Precursor [Bombina maxima]ABZ86095.1 antimicrobial peptide precursor [Bombina microdeladigitora]AAX50240.1 antimicrobial peptide precursor [Bombina maxima]ABX58750.1 maximin-21 antimicrobial peptide precursor [Bombina maxima]ABX58781.1 maximin-21 antimicrobial peptide precursor [Bombina maxima]ABX58789.1 maximin-21 antimicrobial peptide precursor [Bombina max